MNIEQAVCQVIGLILLLSLNASSLHAQAPDPTDLSRSGSGVEPAPRRGPRPKITVAPWNNHPAAFTLAFDDALNVHLDVAAPALDKRHLLGSFFLTVDQITRMPDWKKLLDEGHELGNHSVSHELPGTLTDDGSAIQVLQAKSFFENNFGSPFLDYAYPFGTYDDRLRKHVEETTFIARTVVGDNYYIASDAIPDWFNIPAHEAGLICDEDQNHPCGRNIYKTWIDTAIEKDAWTTVLIHGIGNSDTGYNPIPIDMFNYLLDYSSSLQSSLWIAPFNVVGAYLRGQKLFEAAAVTTDESGSRLTYTWNLAAHMLPGTVIKIKISSPGTWFVTQDGANLISADADGLYPISLDMKQATFSEIEFGDTSTTETVPTQQRKAPRSHNVVYRP
jgi:peptidoglycan/xylan/chitin deacetylase (PgdA/CDA1 family)